MSRLFTFGCSYTSYSWPTWADFLGTEFDEFYNYGWPGLGNRAIAERIAEAHARHNFNKNDIVVVQWSTHIRNDWYSSTHPNNIGWRTQGSIFNGLNSDIYDKKWIDTFWDENAYILHTLNNIFLAQNLLENVGCKWAMTSITYINRLGSDYPQNTEHVENIQEKEINLWISHPHLEMYKTEIFEKRQERWALPIGIHSWKNTDLSFKFRDLKNPKLWIDWHPSVIQHNRWLSEELKPVLGISQISSNKTKEWIDKVNDVYDDSRKDFDLFCTNINKQLDDWINPYRGF